MPNVCPFFFFSLSVKKEKTLLFGLFSSLSLSNFFFNLVFRVSFKTLKLGAVKISSLLLFSIHQAAKKQGVSTFSHFFKLKHRRRIKSPHLFSSSSSLYISSLQNRTQRYSFQRRRRVWQSSVESIYSFSEILTRRNNGE